MTNLQLRIVSGVVLAAVVLGLTWLGGLPFRLLAAAIGALVLYEWTTVSKMARWRMVVGVAWGGSAATLVLLVLGLPAVAVLAVALGTVVGTAILARAAGAGFEPATGTAYALFPAVALAFLRGGDTAGLLAIVYLFGIVWATDILAYFVGRAVGGPKLAPSISPGKTWSGAVGGAVAATIAAFAVAVAAGHPSPVLLAALALPLSALSQAGDLYESAFKRRDGVKDSSALIPGHGGVMDRVDGLVAAAVALYVALSLLAGADSPAAGLFASL